MPEFRSLQEYKKYMVSKILPIVVKNVANRIAHRLKEHVDEDVYFGNKPNYYANGTGQSTFELRESIVADNVKVSGDSVELTVHHDKNLMTFDPDNFIHGSRYWKNGVTDIRDILPQIVNDGLSGNLFGEGFWTEPRPYFDNMLKEIESQGLIKKWFQEELAKLGIQTV